MWSRSCSRSCWTTSIPPNDAPCRRRRCCDGSPAPCWRPSSKRPVRTSNRPGGRCARLPFTSTTRIGLELDPLARNVIAGGLEIREPEFVARVRRRAAAVALRDATGGRSWDATADLLYLVQNHVIRNSYLPPGDQQHPVERAVTDDRAAILAITERHDGPEGAAAISRWWASHALGLRRRPRPDGRGHRLQRGRPAGRTRHPAGRSGSGRCGGAGRRPAPAAGPRCRGVACSAGRWACGSARRRPPSWARWWWTSNGCTWNCVRGWPGCIR